MCKFVSVVVLSIFKYLKDTLLLETNCSDYFSAVYPSGLQITRMVVNLLMLTTWEVKLK
jgi:hypothetical protein